MFLARRPSASVIERFLDTSRALPLSYERIGIVFEKPADMQIDETVGVIGHGRNDFERARAALMAWKHFAIGWVEHFPDDAPVSDGSVVALLVRHLGFWSLNACRVVYRVGAEEKRHFGFAYGTLTNHAESGEELFEVFTDPDSGDVLYRIRAVSKPRAILTRLGYPYSRLLQARFRHDSLKAMARIGSTIRP